MGDTVLVVGRDDAATEFLASVLRRADIDARPVPSHRAAAETNTVDPTLVLVDTDLDAVRSIRSLADPKIAAVAIVVLGADPAGPDDAAASTDVGATHHVARPVAETTLIQGVQSILSDS